MNDIEKIMDILQRKSGKSREVLDNEIKSIQDEFKGLLTPVGAAYKLAKDLKIDLKLKNENMAKKMKIVDLKPGMEDVTILGRVSRVYASKSFEKNGKKGRVCNLELIDDTGTIKFVLWHRDVEKVETGDIDVGTALEITGAHIRGDEEKIELHTGLGSQVNVINNKELPPVKIETIKINEISQDAKDVSLFARVIEIQELRKFSKEGKEGSLLPLIISDGDKKIRLVVWNPPLSIIKRIKEGMLVRIDHAYAKDGMNGLELHIGWQGRLLLEPKNSPKIAKREELVSENVERKFLRDFENDVAEVRATVVDIHGLHEFYYCNACKAKANGEKCEKCNSTAQKRIIVNIEIDDGTDAMRAVLFHKQAMKFLGLTSITENTDVSAVFETRKNSLIGIEVILQGQIKNNEITGNKEFIVKEVVSKNPDPEKEVELLEKIKEG